MRDLTQIIKRPLITERSSGLKVFNQYVFEVAPWANKGEIRRAVENLFRVKVETVRTMRVPGKLARRGMRSGYRPDWKKAIVELAKGQEIKYGEE